MAPSLDTSLVKAPNPSTLVTKKKKKYTRCLVYISHLPHGFEEKELVGYLSQFGQVTNIRLGRSKKTGVPKGYAFVEFKYQDVGKIVAESMNNYLMFNRLVKCEVVERKSVKLFADKINPKNPPGVVNQMQFKAGLNKSDKDEKSVARRREKRNSKLNKIAKRMNEMLKGGQTLKPEVESEGNIEEPVMNRKRSRDPTDEDGETIKCESSNVPLKTNKKKKKIN